MHQATVAEPIRAVLMHAFDKVAADGYMETHPAWKTLNATPKVEFGSAALPLEYGLVIKYYCDEDTLAAVALSRESPRARENCVDKAIARKFKPRRKETEPIDPRKYLAGVVPIAVTGANRANYSAAVLIKSSPTRTLSLFFWCRIRR